jgi:hypothetical protein
VKLLVILTRKTANNETASVVRADDFPPEATRAGILQWATGQLPETVRGGTVLFFSAEPNEIGGQS